MGGNPFNKGGTGKLITRFIMLRYLYILTTDEDKREIGTSKMNVAYFSGIQVLNLNDQSPPIQFKIRKIGKKFKIRKTGTNNLDQVSDMKKGKAIKEMS